MATVTSIQSPTNVVITPRLVLDYGYDYGSNTVIHEPLSGGMPLVTLRPVQSRAGVLNLLFVTRQAARDCEATLQAVGKYRFQAPETGEDFYFVTTGQAQVQEVPGTPVWTVAIPFREVGP